MGIPHERVLSAIRLSLGRWSTTHDVDEACAQLAAAAATPPVKRLLEPSLLGQGD